MSINAAKLSLLDIYNTWADNRINTLLDPYISTDPEMPKDNENVGQHVIFRDDCKRYVYDLSKQSQYELASFAQHIATIVAGPFTLFGEMFRLYSKSIDTFTFCVNTLSIPKHMVFSLFKASICALRTIDAVIYSAPIAVGFLTWHAGEKIVCCMTKSPTTVLSNKNEIRDIVYESIGSTLLAAGAVFVPVAAIQMFAIPIIFGSIYGTLNNQFTVRICPEYYTMGHHYDGTDLKDHAIKSNNVLIKPIVTGCYASVGATKLAGLILSAAGTIPYSKVAISVPWLRKMVAITCAISLVVAHIFSTIKKRSIEKSLENYAKIVGFTWTEEDKNLTWEKLNEQKRGLIEKQSLGKEYYETKNFIEAEILSPNLPVKYIAGWQANSTRNSIGYLFAGVGSLAIAVSMVYLRIR
jgi:hypothetical protein